MTRRPIDEDEKKLWQSLTKDLKQLKKDKILPPVKLSHRRIRTIIETNQERTRQWQDLPVEKEGIPKGLQINKQISPEKVVVEGRLDLHGLTQEQAWLRLQQFIEYSHQQHKKWVLIITGKGGPEGEGVIRKNIPGWLNSLSLVGAFSFARPQDGGTGAFYVRLKVR